MAQMMNVQPDGVMYVLYLYDTFPVGWLNKPGENKRRIDMVSLRFDYTFIHSIQSYRRSSCNLRQHLKLSKGMTPKYVLGYNPVQPNATCP